MEKTDILIVGGGVIGCATALQAVHTFPKKRVILLEKNPTIGLEASSRNSGVLHSGFHHPVGSLKEKLANRGSKLAKEYAKSHKVPLLECGMLVVIPRVGISSVIVDAVKNIKLFDALRKNARNQNLKRTILSGKAIRQLEPNVMAFAGIFLPEISVIDSPAFMQSLIVDSLLPGMGLFFNSIVVKIDTLKSDNKYGTGFVINDGQFFAKSIINCAGVHSNKIAGLLGLKYEQHLVRGEYYEIVGANKNIVSRLVNPAVLPGSSSKGIHFGPRPDGRLFIGPNFKPVSDGSDYENDKTQPEVFIEAVRSFVPDLKPEDLRWSHSGIRAKLSLDEGSDFVIKLDSVYPPIVNNLGIDSPGLSASMAIAEMNCSLLKPYMS